MILRYVPSGLVGLRVSLGPLLILGAWKIWPGPWMVMMLSIGVISDIFDGIIARRIGVATAILRQADSAADVVFWICAAAAVEIGSPGFILKHAWLLGLLLLSEILVWIISFGKFKRPPATHAYLAKFWGLMLFVAFVLLLSRTGAGIFVDFVLALGILSNIDASLIIAFSKTYPVDVKSLILVFRARL
jgi:CDP-diacylglycerol--glycerol-3-phosphate 3-phosphatidyltransferase